jgi:hypothetical protein
VAYLLWMQPLKQYFLKRFYLEGRILQSEWKGAIAHTFADFVFRYLSAPSGTVIDTPAIREMVSPATTSTKYN